MSKTLVDKKICNTCGAEVRPGSGFCYNCGSAVASEDLPKTEASIDLNEARDAWRESDPAESSDYKTSNIDLKTTKLKEEVIETIDLKPIGKPSDLELNQRFESEITPVKPTVQEDAKLKSAANMRRKAKSFQKKTVEVVWEEPENAPNKWFPIVAIFLILLVVGIFYLAMYLK